MKPDPHSVFNESWMKPERPVTGFRKPDPHAVPDDYDRVDHAEMAEPSVEQILHSVHSEPERDGDMPVSQLDSLIAAKRAKISPLGLTAVVLLTAIAAGPLSVLGTLVAGGQGLFQSVYIVAVGPLIEEVLKLGGLLYLLEKKPWYIWKGGHIVAAACVSAVLFGVIENLVYDGIYLRGMSVAERTNVMEFRWAVTVLMHTGATLIGALGLRRAWQATVAKGKLFDSQIAEPYIAAAVVVHGGYNAAAWLLNQYF